MTHAPGAGPPPDGRGEHIFEGQREQHRGKAREHDGTCTVSARDLRHAGGARAMTLELGVDSGTCLRARRRGQRFQLRHGTPSGHRE